ncbi:hypothetical protein DPSP01_007236 [Paraphaeosphaeria sporulosa]
MGEQGSVMDCFCPKHGAQIGAAGQVRREEKRGRDKVRVEKWLEDVDAAEEGPAPQGEMEEFEAIGVGEGALGEGEGERE